ncbi:hypothetical protein C0995_014225 [Termitomyces sp. Mi166|nr:hypothetical protein C0995_014225 [Termitomyces sp. Mi166\
MDTRDELLGLLQLTQFQKAYDYILCIPLEIRFIWTAAWTMPKILYFITRYIPMFTLGVILYCKNIACSSMESFN